MANVYTEEELEIINKSKNIRLQIVDAMTKDRVPTDSREVRVINEVLTSLDKTVHDTANTRIKHQDSANKEAILDMVAETLKQTAKRRKEIDPSTLVREVPTEYLEIDTVPGETEIQPGRLNPTDFLGHNNDN